MSTVNSELWSIFDARRVKAPELRGLDAAANGAVGWFKNRRRMLKSLRAQAARIEQLEPEVRALGATHFREKVEELKDLAKLSRLNGPALDMALACAREAAWRAIGLRPFDVQIMGALTMISGAIAEMATGEGKTLTASIG